MAGNSGNDFALELIVGVKDLFTQKAKQIDAEVNKLDKDAKEMQKTFDDVSAYQKATQALEDLLKQGNASADQLKDQEKVIDNLGKSLKKAGVDINNITSEEEKLSRQLKETNAQLTKRSGLKDMFKGGLTAVASTGLLKGFLSLGNDIEKIQQLMVKQSNFSREQIYGSAERKFRENMMGTFNISAGDVAGTQTWFNRQNQLSGNKNFEVTNAALKLGNLLEGQVDQESINRALTPLVASGISGNDAAAMLYSTFKQGRGDANDLMDATQEYFANLHSNGLSAQQFFGALIQGTTKGGVFSYDKVADSLKETFNARLADSGVIQTLLGHGKTAGQYMAIKDVKLRDTFGKAIKAFQEDLDAGKDTTGDIGNIYTLLGQVRKNSPQAYQQITTSIGGTMLAEDATKDAATPIGQAILNPNQAIGDYKNQFNVDPSVLLTKGEQLDAAKKVSLDALGNASADATKHLDGFTTALQKATTSLAGISSDHPIISEGLADVGFGLLMAGQFKGAKRLLGGARAFFTNGGIRAAGAGLEEGAGLLSRTGGAIARGAGRGAGWLASGARMGGRWLGPAGDIAAGGISAYYDYQDGNMKGVAGDVGGTLGGMAGGAVAGAAIGSVVPVVGTAIGGILGGALGYWGGDKLGQTLYDWWNDDDKNDQTQQRFKSSVDALPVTDDTMDSAGSATLPDGLNINISQPINIQAMSANPDDISKAVEEALRQSNPELIQQLEYALSQLMATNDHQRPSN